MQFSIPKSVVGFISALPEGGVQDINKGPSSKTVSPGWPHVREGSHPLMTLRHDWSLPLCQNPHEELASDCTWARAKQVLHASCETWEFQQGQNTASPFSLFSLPGNTLSSALQFSSMGDLLLREQQAPSPQNNQFWVQFHLHSHWHKQEQCLCA